MIAVLIALVIGGLTPGVIAVITKLHAATKLKAVLMTVLSAIAGGLSGLLVGLPAGSPRWEQVGISALLAVVAAASTDLGLWNPSGVAPALARMTPNFGLGTNPE